MLIDFMGGATLFGTPTFIFEWWYMSAAVVFVLLVPIVVSLEDKLIPLLLLVIALPRILGWISGRMWDLLVLICICVGCGLCEIRFSKSMDKVQVTCVDKGTQIIGGIVRDYNWIQVLPKNFDRDVLGISLWTLPAISDTFFGRIYSVYTLGEGTSGFSGETFDQYVLDSFADSLYLLSRGCLWYAAFCYILRGISGDFAVRLAVN